MMFAAFFKFIFTAALFVPGTILLVILGAVMDLAMKIIVFSLFNVTCFVTKVVYALFAKILVRKRTPPLQRLCRSLRELSLYRELPIEEKLAFLSFFERTHGRRKLSAKEAEILKFALFGKLCDHTDDSASGGATGPLLMRIGNGKSSPDSTRYFQYADLLSAGRGDTHPTQILAALLAHDSRNS